MNFSCRYLKKFHHVLSGVDLLSIDNNYLIIANIQEQISIIFQMHSVESFMGAVSVSFWPMSLRKHPDRLMGQNCFYSYFLFFDQQAYADGIPRFSKSLSVAMPCSI